MPLPHVAVTAMEVAALALNRPCCGVWPACHVGSGGWGRSMFDRPSMPGVEAELAAGEGDVSADWEGQPVTIDIRA